MTTPAPAAAACSDSLALDAARRALEDMSWRARQLIDTANDAVAHRPDPRGMICAYSLMSSVMQQGGREMPVRVAA